MRIKATPKLIRAGMNGLESAYADYLDIRKSLFSIQEWYFQPIKFLLAPATFYTPDFMVILNNNDVEFHETKGFMRDDANVKVKVCARKYPFPFFVVYRQPNKVGGGWDIRPVPP